VIPESEEDMSEKNCYGVSPRSNKLIYAIIVLLLGIGTALAQNKPDPLKSGFENPPAGARPRVWWHWMNGNITQDFMPAGYYTMFGKKWTFFDSS